MLFLEDRGTGTPVVLMHGAPTTVDHMRPLAEALSSKRRTLLVHLPGYGHSPRLDPYDLDRSHALVEEALRQRGIEAAHFVGLSGGSYRSFAIACRRRVRALSIAGFGCLADVPPEEGAGLLEYARLLREGVDPIPILDEVMLSPTAKENPAIIADVHAWGTATPHDHLANELEAMAKAPDLRLELMKLDVPILLRVGSLDLATPPIRAKRIVAMVTTATLQIVEGKGHAILAEDLAASVAAVEEHLLKAEALGFA